MGCSPSFFFMFIGFATVFNDFRTFELFPLGFALVFNFSGIFSSVFVVVHWFLFVSLFFYGSLWILVYLGFVNGLFRVCLSFILGFV